MQWQGKIDFAKPITLNGKPHGVEQLTSLPTWTSGDQGRVIYSMGTGKLWVGTLTGWEELTPGGIATHSHDDLYYTESEVDNMFEGKNGEKQIINWVNVTNKPTTFTPEEHTHPIYLTQPQIDFSFMQTQGLVGSGANQLAQGNHTHTGFALDGHTHTEYSLVDHEHEAVDVFFDNTTSGMTAASVQSAIDEMDEKLDRADILITREFWVDKTSPGTYTPNGSRMKPFKSITEALAVATPGSSVYVGAGTYTENFTIPNRVSLHGAGLSKTILMGGGTINVGDGQPNATTHFTGCSIRQHINIDMEGGKVIFRDAYISNEGWVTVTSGSADGLSISTTTTNPALTINSSGTITCMSAILAATTGSAVVHNSGVLAINNCTVQGFDTTNPVILSTGGQFVSSDSFVMNMVGGPSMNIDNGATALAPNILNDIIHTGGLTTGSAITIIEGINGGKPISTVGELNHLYTPASMTSYDGTTSGLTAKNVQGAIDELGAMVGVTPPTSGIPVDSPDSGTMRFDTATNTLYIYNGTGWVSTILS